MPADKIFICYRREDSTGHAGRIYDRLNQRFPERVFRDVDKIPILNRWETVVDETLRSCAVAIIVIGSRWLDQSADGKRRLDRHDDPVRKEIAALLGLKVDLIPVLLGGVAVPARDSLPPDVAALVDWQAIRIDEDDFEHDINRLTKAIEDRFGKAPAPAPAPAPASPGAGTGWKDVLSRYQKDWNDQGPALMAVEDTFNIAGRGPVVTGRIARGRLRPGDTVELVGIRKTRTVTVTGVEMARKLLDEVLAGDECGVLLSGVTHGEIEKGQALAGPASVEATATLSMRAYLLRTEEGGLSNPIVDGERLQFYIHTIDVDGTIALRGAPPQMRPGDERVIDVHLSRPMAIAKSLVIPLRRGGKTVGFGSILGPRD